MTAWMSYFMQVPVDSMQDVEDKLAELGFTQSSVDYCELVREDGSRASYGPCEPPTGLGDTS